MPQKDNAMKTVVLFISIFGSSLCCAQEMTTWQDIEMIHFGKETVYKTKQDKTLEGYYKIASDDGRYSEIHFNDGKITGTRKNFNSQGALTGILSYKEGKSHGKWTYFDETGELESIENYKDGNKHGKWWKKKFKNNNYYIATAHYKNDLPVGTWTEKWKNGHLKEERTYKGKGTYVHKEYHKNGKLQTQKSYKNFKLHGDQLVFSVSGVLLNRDVYNDDVLEKRETFFDNGQPYQIYTYLNGELHGKCLVYKSSGAKSLELEYKNGYKSGVWKKYMGDNGWLYFETTYENDARNGPHKTYYISGIVEKKGNYLNGVENGTWQFYDQTGKLVKEVEYDKGTEVLRKEYNRP